MKAKGVRFFSEIKWRGPHLRFSSSHGAKILTACIICVLFCLNGHSQSRDCKDCDIPSFQSVTMYYIGQPHSSFGFGVEAGKWNKSESRFSYFLGARMQWFMLDPNSAKFNNVADNVRFSAYVNLTSFDAAVGLRYSYPLSEVIGIGIEPTYSFVQKEYSLNANIHFAL